MRRDVFISNDSGGLSVVAADAVPAIIEDGREDDRAFAAKHQAILLSLHGDDSPIVRIVVDEPLTPDEDAQWLARVRRKLVTPAGRIAVAGGFDPDVFADWQDAGAPAVEKDDRVVAVAVPAGAWIVDVYTHVDSMNGGELLDQRSARHGGIGGWFRAGHPGRAWPLWLARRLWGDGERDPGHEALWSAPLESIRAGDLKVATRPIGFVGFLVHLHAAGRDGSLTRLPGDGWFDTRTGSRRLATLPLGLSSKITRRGQPLADEIAAGLRKAGPRASRKPRLASASTPVLDTWTGGPLQRFRGKPVEVPLDYLAIVYLLALMATDGSPALDVKVTNSSGWFLPPSGAGYVITGGGSKFRGGTRVGVTGAEALDGVDPGGSW